MIVASNWPPYIPEELPPALVGELEGILRPLYVATLELHRTVYRYELLRALGHDWLFVNKINRTTAAPALTTVRGCVNTAIVVSLCAFFDEAAGAVNLKAMLNRVLRPGYADRFRDFHAAINPTFDVDRHLARLVRMQRRLRPGNNTGKAIERVSNLRNQIVAHLDTQPEFAKGYPDMADMATVLAAVANIMVSTVRLVIAERRIEPSCGRRDARLQAFALTQAIQPLAPEQLREALDFYY